MIGCGAFVITDYASRHFYSSDFGSSLIGYARKLSSPATMFEESAQSPIALPVLLAVRGDTHPSKVLDVDVEHHVSVALQVALAQLQSEDGRVDEKDAICRRERWVSFSQPLVEQTVPPTNDDGCEPQVAPSFAPKREAASVLLLHDESLLRNALKIDGRALRHASRCLQSRRDIAEVAIAQNAWAIRHVGPALLADKALALLAVSQNGLTLRALPAELRGDRDVVSRALTENPASLESASEEFRGERELILNVVRRNGQSLRHASQQLQADADVVLAAISQDGMAIGWAVEALRGDRCLALKAIEQNAMALQVLPEQLKGDRDIVIAAVKGNIAVLTFASEALQADGAVAIAALEAPRICKPKRNAS